MNTRIVECKAERAYKNGPENLELNMKNFISGLNPVYITEICVDWNVVMNDVARVEYLTCCVLDNDSYRLRF